MVNGNYVGIYVYINVFLFFPPYCGHQACKKIKFTIYLVYLKLVFCKVKIFRFAFVADNTPYGIWFLM